MMKHFFRIISLGLVLALLCSGNFTWVRADQVTPPSQEVAPAQPDLISPQIMHDPIDTVFAGLVLPICAQVKDDVAVTSVVLFYRASGQEEWMQLPMESNGSDLYTATIAAEQTNVEQLEYYIEATDGTNISYCASPSDPFLLHISEQFTISKVTPELVDLADAAAGTAAIVEGQGFQEDMTVTVQGQQVPFTFVNDQQIQFVLPALGLGAAELHIRCGEDRATLTDAFTYYDKSASVQISCQEKVFIGQTLQLPVKLDTAQPITELSFEVKVNDAYLTNGDFTLSENNHDAQAEWIGGADGIITVHILSEAPLNTGDNVGYLSFYVPFAAGDVQTEVQVLSASIQDTPVKNLTGCSTQISTDFQISLLNVPEGLYTAQDILPDFSGWQLELDYEGQIATIPVTEDMLELTVNTPGNVLGKVHYMGKTAEFQCRILDPMLISLNLKEAPTVREYWTGEALDLTGLELLLIYGEEFSEPLTNISISGYDPMLVGQQTVTISYGKYFTYSYEITMLPGKIQSDGFTVFNGYISGIAPGTTAGTVLDTIAYKEFAIIYDGNAQVPADQILTTGMTIQLVSENGMMDMVTVVVQGDANGDGKVSISDVLVIRRHILEISELSDAATLAVDYNDDGRITITEFLRLKKQLLEEYPEESQ